MASVVAVESNEETRRVSGERIMGQKAPEERGSTVRSGPTNITCQDNRQRISMAELDN